MTSRENMLQKKPPPPATLNKALLAVWSAWGCMSDREVVREASTKGSHVDWAYKFLSARKKLELFEIQNWFKEEVFVWVLELLSRKQIFKASHILNNIKLNANDEFTKIFLETHDVELRDYLGEHLLKFEQLDPLYRGAWNLLKIIEDRHEFLLDLNYEDVRKLNVKEVSKHSYEWKSNIGTQLFFKTFEISVKPFVTAECAWKLLLKTNLELLKLWINVYFSRNINFKFIYINPQIFRQLKQMFEQFCITEEMINLVDNENFMIPEESKCIVLNELSRFGIFNCSERNNLVKILRRLVDCGNIDLLHQVLAQEHATVTLYRFYQLLLEHCVDKKLFCVLNWCNLDFNLCGDLERSYKLKELNLLLYLKNENNLNHSLGIGQNIFKIAEFLGDDLESYLSNNPLILLSIFMLLYPDLNLLETFCTKQINLNLENFEFTQKLITEAQKALPFLDSVINKSICPPQTISFYDLLENHSNINRTLFNFQKDKLECPNFSSTDLVEAYGYKKIINFKFYLKQARPCIAMKLLNEVASSVDRSSIVKKVYKLVFQNYFDNQITAGCVAFLQLLGENTQTLRIYIKSANILAQSDIKEDITQLLKNIYKNPHQFLCILEKALLANCVLTSDYSSVDLIDEIRQQEIAIKFAEVHNLKLPECFLKHCAENDLWFPFVIYIQIYNYPLNQVQKLLQNFHNYDLVEHLLHGLSHDIQLDEQNVRDSRTYYLSRIGVRKTPASSDLMCSSTSSWGSSGSSSTSSEFSENDELKLKTDFLETLIRCHNSVDPPKSLLHACYVYKSPIFAVLATSYEPDSIITNWLMWLSVSCGIEREFSRVEGLVINADTISDLLVCAFKSGYGNIVYESFEIFLPDNPLKIITDFLNNCIDFNFDFDVQVQKLELFYKTIGQRNANVVTEVDYEMCVFDNIWIETTALMLITTILQHNFSSRYYQLKYLKFLQDVCLYKYFSIRCPDFLKYYNILNYLVQSKCDIKLDLSVIADDDIIGKNLEICVQELINIRLYDYAYKIAQIQGTCTDFIVITEWYNKFEVRNNIKEFWDECSSRFIAANVQSFEAVRFFVNCSEKVDDKTEKYNILNLAYKWAFLNNLEACYDIERKKWIAYFDMEVKHNDHDFVQEGHGTMLYREMIQKLEALKVQNKDLVTLNDVQLSILEKTVNKLLNIGDLWQALRLVRIFNYTHSDIEMIELSCSLTEGLLFPHQLTVEQRVNFFKSSSNRSFSWRRRTLMSSISSSLSSITSSLAPVTSTGGTVRQDILTILETVSERVKCGSKLVNDIHMAYRISVNTDRSYEEIFTCTNSLKMLKEVFYDDCANKLEVVQDFCLLFNWSTEQIADFTCEQLISTISNCIKSKTEPIILWNLRIDVDFHLILQLLVENCSVLGMKLYSYATAVLKSQTQANSDFRISEINVVIELLIRAHDCFTADCNMEGISIILRKSQSLINLLLTLKSWKLIVRLLTGVARYTEMSYVFHILRENHQFEFLLRKGNRMDNGLKIALLKYLKKYCPEDQQLYEMVALHFTLFSEIAQIWEDEAKSVIRNLIAISKLEMQNNGLNVDLEPYVLLSNTEGTKLCLKKAMANFTHATDYHMQGEKVTKAAYTINQAELIALQMSFLRKLPYNGTCFCLINITEIQIVSLILYELSFPQTLILIQAYNFKADWSSILFQQFVIQNRTDYLTQFMECFSLSDSLVYEISRKFMTLKAISDNTIKNMKEIVSQCSSIYTKYRIASELGFGDIVQELLAGNQLAYLKDTVWKKGYKS